MEIKQQIRNFIIENFFYGQEEGSLSDDTSFLEKGIIDSTGVLELVSFIEGTYGISVADQELIPENFDSLQKLSDFIIYKQGGNGN